MKNKFWLIQVPLVALFTFAFWVTEMGTDGRLENALLRDKFYPGFRRISSLFTDIKFKIRGPQPPKNKIVIIEIDSPSLEKFGRWPWHRDMTAFLIDKTFQAGAKVVGLDIMFSEPDQRIPDELGKILQSQKLGHLIDQFETDKVLEAVINAHSSNLVLGWATESACQPLYSDRQECPVAHPDAIAGFPEGIEKFSYSHVNTNSSMPFNPEKTPVLSIPTMIPNIQPYNNVAQHAGYLNGFGDPDGVIRRTSLLMIANSKPYPSIPMEMARVGLGEELQVTMGADQRVESLGFAKSGKMIPVTPLGTVEVNFRGPSHSFTYVSAEDILNDDDIVKDELNRKIAGASKKELLKDAYVFIGLSAIGASDIKAFPFDSLTPGVEGHANILDNILSDDSLRSGSSGNGTLWITFLMVVGALVFGYVTQKLEAIPALVVFILVASGLGVADIQLLFRNNLNWNTSFLCIEISTIFVFTLAIKYVMEERNKKFIRSAFSKYVAPAIVDSILKDPTKLSLGGEKRELTILFSDIRSFTSFSEHMDAKALASFLNDYLGIMTKLVFAHQGTLDKYIGDAVMAFWGAPLDQADHAANACTSAIAMMKALADNKGRFKSQYGIDVDIGIGINSGNVNVGNMGSDQNFEYTVIGDHVNLASRLEGLTKAYGASIVTSRFTFDDIERSGKPLPPHRILDFVKVKGKKKAVELIQIFDKEYPAQGIGFFQEGRTLYSQQKWDQAIEKFSLANQSFSAAHGSSDGPTLEFMQRCNEFKNNPPSNDWDGSWEMHSK